MRYYCIKQHDITDCGVACLATICKQKLKWVKQIGICRISKSRFWEIQECVSLWF